MKWASKVTKENVELIIKWRGGNPDQLTGGYVVNEMYDQAGFWSPTIPRGYVEVDFLEIFNIGFKKFLGKQYAGCRVPKWELEIIYRENLKYWIK